MINNFIKEYSEIQENIERLLASIKSINELDEFSSIDANIRLEGIHSVEFEKYINYVDNSAPILAHLSYTDKLLPSPQEFDIELTKEGRENYEELILKNIWQKN